jgi:ATP-binding cassette subfamily F protein uup
MPVISATDVRKIYDHDVVLGGVSITIGDGERVGVVGNNGCGKSTLGRILAGVETPDAGTVAVQRGAKVAYLAQEPSFSPGETVRDAVLSGLGEWNAAHARYERAVEELERGDDVDYWLTEQSAAAELVEHAGGWERLHEAEAILGKLGVEDVEASVDTLSGGRRRAVGLAKVLLSAPALAILDEPTNHLDVDTIEWLEEYLRESYRGALLLITHDRYVLNRVVMRTVEIDRGSLFSYDGGYEAYLEAKAERIAHAERAESNRRNFLRQELEWLRRSPKARTGKQKARIDRARAAIDRAPSQADKVADLRVTASRTGKTILEAEGLSVERGGACLVRDFTLKLAPGRRIGIVGPNGCGKTSLLRVLLGVDDPAAGNVTIGANTRIAYLDQTRAGLVDNATIEDNVAGDRAYFQIGGRSVSVRTYLERFLFEPSAARRLVSTLSGGEKARVALAKLLAGEANLIVLDEPTNDLDVATLGALETLISEFQGTVLLVSHDRWFLDRLATSILAFGGSGTVEQFEGNYSEYREKVESSSAESGTPAKKKQDIAASTPPKVNKLTFAERIELEGLLEKIEAADLRVRELEASLADPDSYADGGDRVKSLVVELETAKSEAEALTARWEELESKPS